MFLKYSGNISSNYTLNHSRKYYMKHFMKYFSNNEVIIPVILKNYFSIFQEMLVKYFNNNPTNAKANYW